MAKGRIISCSLSTSRKFAALYRHAGALAEFAQSLFPLVVVHCDDFGRMSGDAWSVKFQTHPASPRTEAEFDIALVALERSGLIVRYGDNDAKCLAVIDFDSHQGGLHKRTSSKFPEPPGNSRKFPEIPSDTKGYEGILIRTDTEGVPPPVPVPDLPAGKPLAYRPRIGVAWPGRPPVPAGLHAEFVEKLGGEDPDSRLRAWYPTAAAVYADRPIGDDDFTFWRARFREWLGTTVKPVQPAEEPIDMDALTKEAERRIAARKANRR